MALAGGRTRKEDMSVTAPVDAPIVWDAIESKLTEDGAPDELIRLFRSHVETAAERQAGVLAEAELQPVREVIDWLALDRQAPPRPLAVIKLNGGLGTSMGLERAKSLIPVKGDLTFLDVIVRQTLALRRRHAVAIPLILMNSFSTREDCLAYAARYPTWGDGQQGLPLDFLQHRVPKLHAETFMPASCPDRPHLEWCPPGHGNLYVALRASGLLEQLRARGIRYAFVSNADNLGAIPDMAVPAYMEQHDLPFLMEVADRTAADRKGGHLAARPDGRLVLRESAQCAKEDQEAFQDIRRHRFFNTNNLWLDLDRLDEALKADAIRLPLIVNRKTLDPRDPSSPPVLQLETAMGAAISSFEGARALRVPRARFAPVKTTEDLLVVRSDLYRLTDDARLEIDPAARAPSPSVTLDARYYKSLSDFEARFPNGMPSLKGLLSLKVQGDVRFEPEAVLSGRLRIVNETEAQACLSETPAGAEEDDREDTWHWTASGRWERPSA